MRGEILIQHRDARAGNGARTTGGAGARGNIPPVPVHVTVEDALAAAAAAVSSVGDTASFVIWRSHSGGERTHGSSRWDFPIMGLLPQSHDDPTDWPRISAPRAVDHLDEVRVDACFRGNTVPSDECRVFGMGSDFCWS